MGKVLLWELGLLGAGLIALGGGSMGPEHLGCFLLRHPGTLTSGMATGWESHS